MNIPFQKYQATGNDFVIIDNREEKIKLRDDQIIKICDRKFGVGADGLMLIQPHPSVDFNLIYFNADGSSSLCGNGSRAAVKMAATLALFQEQTTFNAYDGLHQAALLKNGDVRLKMGDVEAIKKIDNHFFINTGSPHFVQFIADAKKFPVFVEGKNIRYSELFKPNGTNANFVELCNDSIFVRTYERGVENETLSCGTGVTAAAIAASYKNYKSPISIHTLGGKLSVEFTSATQDTFTDIYLTGPAEKVFEGIWKL